MPIIKFRQDVVRTVPYVGDGHSQSTYWDDGLAGFGMRVHSSGLRTYVCSCCIDRRNALSPLGGCRS